MKYELLLVLPGTLDDKEVEAQLGEILNLVKEFGTDVVSTAMGKNRLAYPIKQIRYGYFYTVLFEAEKQKVRALQAKLSITRNILRAMITHFSAELTAGQKTAYIASATTGMAAPQTAPAPAQASIKSAAVQVEELVADEVKAEEKPAKIASKAERKIDVLDMDAISKKLDDLMDGDVIPGV